ncbi:MAG: hypothetical protein ACREHG_03785 [Candidatus Saccharimonadales bacterium]
MTTVEFSPSVSDDNDVVVGKGYCLLCATPLSDGRRKYCAECGPKRPATSAKRPSRSAPTGTITAGRASETFAKLIIIITAIYAYGVVRRRELPDPGGKLAEELAMTDAEALPIARVIGRMASSNTHVAKAIGPLVDNDDLIDAAFAMWDYTRRTHEVLDRYTQNIAPRKAQNVPAEQDNQDNGIVDQYDSQRDYSSII